MVLAGPSRTSVPHRPRLVLPGSDGQLRLVGLHRGPCVALSQQAGMTSQDLCPSVTTASDDGGRADLHGLPLTCDVFTSLVRPRHQTRRSAWAWLCMSRFHRSPKTVTGLAHPVCAPPSSLPASVHSQKCTEMRFLRQHGAIHAARSVLVGSHHLDGLLHRWACELVASRIRPWGSPRSTEAHTPCEGFPPADTVPLSPAFRPPLPSVVKRLSHLCTTTLPRCSTSGRSTPQPDCEGLTPTGSVD